MSALFNSLGSNYSEKYISLTKQLLWNKKSSDSHEKLEVALSHYLPKGEFLFYYKGRDAIAAALNLCNTTKNKKVFIQAFACYAIEEAVVRAGLKPCYVDIGKETLNVSVGTLDVASKKHGLPAVVLIQHTLGISAEISSIRRWCDKNNVLLIEDLAQAFGARDSKGNYVGSSADFVIGSFGRDKIIDAVSGGFLYIPTSSMYHHKLETVRTRQQLSVWAVKKDLLYPLVTDFFRTHFPSLISKLVLEAAKKLHIIVTPLAAPKSAYRLPAEHALLALEHLSTMNKQLAARRTKAEYYFDQLKELKNVKMVCNRRQIQHGANVRFPLLVPNPEKVIDACKKEQIFISDRWYRAPVDCSTLECNTVYIDGSCPNAENACKQIINLPTHMYVEQSHVEIIVAIIKKYS